MLLSFDKISRAMAAAVAMSLVQMLVPVNESLDENFNFFLLFRLFRFINISHYKYTLNTGELCLIRYVCRIPQKDTTF